MPSFWRDWFPVDAYKLSEKNFGFLPTHIPLQVLNATKKTLFHSWELVRWCGNIFLYRNAISKVRVWPNNTLTSVPAIFSLRKNSWFVQDRLSRWGWAEGLVWCLTPFCETVILSLWGPRMQIAWPRIWRLSTLVWDQSFFFLFCFFCVLWFVSSAVLGNLFCPDCSKELLYGYSLGMRIPLVSVISRLLGRIAFCGSLWWQGITLPLAVQTEVLSPSINISKPEIWPQRPRYFAAPPPPYTTASVEGVAHQWGMALQ